MTNSAIPKRLASLAGVVVIAAACSTPGTSTAPTTAAATAE